MIIYFFFFIEISHLIFFLDNFYENIVFDISIWIESGRSWFLPPFFFVPVLYSRHSFFFFPHSRG